MEDAEPRNAKRVSAPSSKRLKEALSFSLFANLDADLVHRIFSFLSQPQALQARLVCRRWADLARYHVHRVDAADDPDIVREVSETFPHWQEINLLYQMPCVTVAEWRAIVEGLGPRIVNVRRLSLCVDGENDRIVLQETFRLLVSFTRLTHLRIVGENVAQQDRREFWAGLLSLLETNQESLENIAIGFEWEPGSGTFPALPRLRVVRMYCDSSVLDALSASPHLEMIEAHGWAENCTEESRVRFAQAHPKLMRVCIDIPLAPSTRMLAGLPQCKVENGANDMIPLGMGSSMYFVLTQTVLIDDLDVSRIRMICIKKPYNTAEMIQLAAKCPNLEVLDMHDSLNSLRIPKATFHSVQRLRVGRSSSQRIWPLFPNVRVVYDVMDDVLPLAKSCLFLEEVHVHQDAPDLVQAVLLMPNLKRLHIITEELQELREITDILGRERPLLSVCHCKLLWSCTHPWFY